MRYLYLFLAFFPPATAALAQDATILQEGIEIKEVRNKGEIYIYKQFTAGEVNFKDGARSKARLNYNLLLREMQFVDVKGDTLSLANENVIKYIAISSDTFYYNKEYLQLVTGKGEVKLAVNQRILMVDNKTPGAYGELVPSSSVTSFNNIGAGDNFTKLRLSQVVNFKLENRYYLGDKLSNFIPLNKKNLLKRFSKQQSKVEEYLHQNSTNFNQRDDVIKLFGFLAKLE